MRILMINHIHNARQSLRNNRVRSMLTMLGVTIGVASVTAILMLSAGASEIVKNQIDSMGGNLAVVRPGKNTDFFDDIFQAQTSRNYNVSTVTESDVSVILKNKSVKLASPLMVLGGTIKAESQAPFGSPVVATNASLAEISNLEIHDGQFLDDNMSGGKVVVGRQLSINIFGTETSIGRQLTIKGQPFAVIGVLSRVNNPINFNSVDFDNAAIISFADGKALNSGVSQIQQIDVRFDKKADAGKLIGSLTDAIRINHSGENDFSVLVGSQISQPTSQFFYLITGVSTAIATISLVVGGIGIMNIMLVTVAERTREIGIRKALGASNVDIAMQFLIESLAISFAGGLSGCVVGCLSAYLISSFLTFAPVINLHICAVSMAVSVVVGVIFGTYPAVRAAGKNPIDSLYQYH